MDRHAKIGDGDHDRRFFVGEHLTTPVMPVLLLGIPTLIDQVDQVDQVDHVDQGVGTHELRLGFTAVPPREFSFGMPVNGCSSPLAGVVPTRGLRGVFGVTQPSAVQFVTSRSPAAVARADLSAGSGPTWRVAGAGVSVTTRVPVRDRPPEHRQRYAPSPALGGWPCHRT